MSEPIQIESIRRLDVHPGETLVVRLPGSITREQFDEITDMVEARLPEGVKVLIATTDVELDVIAAVPE